MTKTEGVSPMTKTHVFSAVRGEYRCTCGFQAKWRPGLPDGMHEHALKHGMPYAYVNNEVIYLHEKDWK